MTATTALPLNGGGRRNGNAPPAPVPPAPAATPEPSIKLVSATAPTPATKPTPEAKPEKPAEGPAVTAPTSTRRVDDEGQPFSWDFNGPTAGAIAFQESPAVAVYWDVRDRLVIRQKAEWPHDEEDSIIVIPRDRAELFLLAVRTEVED